MQLIWSKNEGAIADPACPEHSFGWNLMTCIFGTGKPSKHPEHSESVRALALRWRLGCPLDRRASTDVGFTPLCSKRSEAVEQVLMHFHAETCRPAKLKIGIHQLAQHGNTSGHGRTIARRRFTSTLA